jgi:hypothetical protein
MRRSLALAAAAAACLAGCGSDVSVCLDFDDDPPSCELCANGRDDDLDGRVDCQDSDCRDTADCAKELESSPAATTVPGVAQEAGAREAAGD